MPTRRRARLAAQLFSPDFRKAHGGAPAPDPKNPSSVFPSTRLAQSNGIISAGIARARTAPWNRACPLRARGKTPRRTNVVGWVHQFVASNDTVEFPDFPDYPNAGRAWRSEAQSYVHGKGHWPRAAQIQAISCNRLSLTDLTAARYQPHHIGWQHGEARRKKVHIFCGYTGTEVSLSQVARACGYSRAFRNSTPSR